MKQEGKQDAQELTSLAIWQVLLPEDWLLVEVHPMLQGSC